MRRVMDRLLCIMPLLKEHKEIADLPPQNVRHVNAGEDVESDRMAEGHKEQLRLLIAKGADVNAFRSWSKTRIYTT